MSVSRHTPAEWDALFVRYLASDQTQRVFCAENDVPFDSFRSRYQRSKRFAGRRRRSSPESDAPSAGSGFVAVRKRQKPVTRPAASTGVAAVVTIRVGDGVTIECPIEVGATNVASIARALSR